MEAIEDDARKEVAAARDGLPEAVDAEATLITGKPAEALLDVTAEPGTMLVVGSRGYGPLRRVLLGSVSTRLVRSAPCPLIVTPRGMHEEEERAATAADARSA